MTTFSSLQNVANEMIDAISQECVAQVFTQFQNLMNAGVLVVKQQKPTVSLEHSLDGGYKLRASSAVELTFRGEEEIARLKDENQKLHAKLQAISHAIKEIPNG